MVLSGVYTWQVAELSGLQAGQCPLGVDLIKGPILAPGGTHVHPQALPTLLLCVALGGFSACSPGPNILTPQNDGAGVPPA